MGRKETDGTRSVSILFDEAAMVLSAGSRVDGNPAMLTVIAKAMDIPTEVWGKATATLQSVTLVTDLIIQDVWFDLHLMETQHC